MTKEEALTLALETLEISLVFVMSHEMIKQPEGADWYDNRITAIKEALAQPEERNFCPRCGKRTADPTTIHTCTPPQSQGVGLTVDELIDLERKHLSHENLTRAIEAKLREKNT